MLTQWLFGIPRERSYVIDLETAVDVANRLRELRPNADVQWWVNGLADRRRVDENQLFGLSQVDRSRLLLEAPESGFVDAEKVHPWSGTTVINFGINQNPWLQIVQDPDESVTRALQAIIADNGRVRLIRHPIKWRALLQYLPASAIAAAWVWVAVSQRPSLPALILGSAAVFFAFWLSYPRYRNHTGIGFGPNRQPGHFIRMDTRAERAQRRANTKRDVVVALVTAPISVALAILIAWLSGVLKLND